jgi:hypothetical protein
MINVDNHKEKIIFPSFNLDYGLVVTLKVDYQLINFGNITI